MNTEQDEIKIKRVATEKATTPRNDGSAGSALYSIPFELSSTPANEWAEYFVHTWNRPPEWTSKHRPGIASIVGNEIWLNGTTIEEVESTHKKTLELCVREANRKYKALLVERQQKKAIQDKKEDDHKRNIEEKGRNIKFE